MEDSFGQVAEPSAKRPTTSAPRRVSFSTVNLSLLSEKNEDDDQNNAEYDEESKNYPSRGLSTGRSVGAESSKSARRRSQRTPASTKTNLTSSGTMGSMELDSKKIQMSLLYTANLDEITKLVRKLDEQSRTIQELKEDRRHLRDLLQRQEAAMRKEEQDQQDLPKYLDQLIQEIRIIKVERNKYRSRCEQTEKQSMKYVQEHVRLQTHNEKLLKELVRLRSGEERFQDIANKFKIVQAHQDEIISELKDKVAHYEQEKMNRLNQESLIRAKKVAEVLELRDRAEQLQADLQEKNIQLNSARAANERAQKGFMFEVKQNQMLKERLGHVTETAGRLSNHVRTLTTSSFITQQNPTIASSPVPRQAASLSSSPLPPLLAEEKFLPQISKKDKKVETVSLAAEIPSESAIPNANSNIREHLSITSGVNLPVLVPLKFEIPEPPGPSTMKELSGHDVSNSDPAQETALPAIINTSVVDTDFVSSISIKTKSIDHHSPTTTLSVKPHQTASRIPRAKLAEDKRPNRFKPFTNTRILDSASVKKSAGHGILQSQKLKTPAVKSCERNNSQQSPSGSSDNDAVNLTHDFKSTLIDYSESLKKKPLEHVAPAEATPSGKYDVIAETQNKAASHSISVLPKQSSVIKDLPILESKKLKHNLNQETYSAPVKLEADHKKAITDIKPSKLQPKEAEPKNRQSNLLNKEQPYYEMMIEQGQNPLNYGPPSLKHVPVDSEILSNAAVVTTPMLEARRVSIQKEPLRTELKQNPLATDEHHWNMTESVDTVKSWTRASKERLSYNGMNFTATNLFQPEAEAKAFDDGFFDDFEVSPISDIPPKSESVDLKPTSAQPAQKLNTVDHLTSNGRFSKQSLITEKPEKAYSILAITSEFDDGFFENVEPVAKSKDSFHVRSELKTASLTSLSVKSNQQSQQKIEVLENSSKSKLRSHEVSYGSTASANSSMFKATNSPLSASVDEFFEELDPVFIPQNKMKADSESLKNDESVAALSQPIKSHSILTGSGSRSQILATTIKPISSKASKSNLVETNTVNSLPQFGSVEKEEESNNKDQSNSSNSNTNSSTKLEREEFITEFDKKNTVSARSGNQSALSINLREPSQERETESKPATDPLGYVDNQMKSETTSKAILNHQIALETATSNVEPERMFHQSGSVHNLIDGQKSRDSIQKSAQSVSALLSTPVIAHPSSRKSSKVSNSGLNASHLSLPVLAAPVRRASNPQPLTSDISIKSNIDYEDDFSSPQPSIQGSSKSSLAQDTSMHSVTSLDEKTSQTELMITPTNDNSQSELVLALLTTHSEGDINLNEPEASRAESNPALWPKLCGEIPPTSTLSTSNIFKPTMFKSSAMSAASKPNFSNPSVFSKPGLSMGSGLRASQPKIASGSRTGLNLEAFVFNSNNPSQSVASLFKPNISAISASAMKKSTDILAVLEDATAVDLQSSSSKQTLGAYSTTALSTRILNEDAPTTVPKGDTSHLSLTSFGNTADLINISLDVAQTPVKIESQVSLNQPTQQAVMVKKVEPEWEEDFFV